MKKNILTLLGETIDRFNAENLTEISTPQPNVRSTISRWLHFLLPNGGTIMIVLVLLVSQPVWARSLQTMQNSNSSTGTIAYQGRLANTNGSPVTGTLSMVFRLYNVQSGGSPVWEEQWTASNSVAVSDGLFNVMLGSITPINQATLSGNSSLWLGISVGTDGEMTPRVQLGTVPYAFQALTVPDGAITSAKLADGSVTQAKFGPDVSLVPPDGSITTAKLTNQSVTNEKLGLASVLSKNVAFSRYQDYNPAAINTNLTTYQPTNVSVTFTCDYPCTAYVQHRGLVAHSINIGRVNIAIYADGVGAFSELGYVTSNTLEPVEGSGYINLPAGSHTVSVYFACDVNTGGSCIYYGDPTAAWEHLDVLVFAQP